jgi:hypothetical protein
VQVIFVPLKAVTMTILSPRSKISRNLCLDWRKIGSVEDHGISQTANFCTHPNKLGTYPACTPMRGMKKSAKIAYAVGFRPVPIVYSGEYRIKFPLK